MMYDTHAVGVVPGPHHVEHELCGLAEPEQSVPWRSQMVGRI